MPLASSGASHSLCCSDEDDIQEIEPNSPLITQSVGATPCKASTFQHQDIINIDSDDEEEEEEKEDVSEEPLEPTQSPSHSEGNGQMHIAPIPISLLKTPSYNIAPEKADERQLDQPSPLTTQSNNMISQKADRRQIETTRPLTSQSNNTIPQNTPNFQDVQNEATNAEHSQTPPTNSDISQSSSNWMTEIEGSQGEQDIKIEAADADISQMVLASLESSQSPSIMDNNGRQLDLTSFLASQSNNRAHQKPPIFQHFHPPADPTCSTGQLKLICKYCAKLVSGSYKATSNFHTHVKVSIEVLAQ